MVFKTVIKYKISCLCNILKWRDGAGQDVCKEKVSESDFHKPRNQDHKQSFCQFTSCSFVTTAKARLKTEDSKVNNEEKQRPCRYIFEQVVKLSHYNCSCEACTPNEKENHADSVELIMRHLILLVQAEDVDVVNAIRLEDLDDEACSK